MAGSFVASGLHTPDHTHWTPDPFAMGVQTSAMIERMRIESVVPNAMGTIGGLRMGAPTNDSMAVRTSAMGIPNERAQTRKFVPRTMEPS